MQQDTFHSHQDYEQVDVYRKLRLFNIGRSLRDCKVTTYLQLAQKKNISTNFFYNFLFLSTLSDTLRCYAKRYRKSRVFQGVIFEHIDSFTNNGTKNLSIFDDSCEEICYSETLVDIATTGRRRGLNTFHNKHNLFHQSKLGGDVALQNTHIVFFKPPCDAMQISTLSAKLGFGSELVD